MGLMLKGVVIATYVIDDVSHPFQDKGQAPEGPITVYCDVIIYSNISGFRRVAIPKCLVLQKKGGIHNDNIWKPRATSIDVSGSESSPAILDVEGPSNPANFDGDHVLVGFMNDQLNEPIILGGIPHPNADIGAEDSQTRKSLRLKQVDGDPDFWKHHGTVYGIDDNGDFLLDSRFANDGKLKDDGHEKDAPTDGSGAQRFALPLDAEFKVTLSDMGDEDNPEEKMKFTFNKTTIDIEYVDSGMKVLIDDGNDRVKITTGSGLEFLVDGQSNKVEAGEENASEKASIDSKLQDNLIRLRDDLHLLADEVAKSRAPLPEFPFPILFADLLECFAQPLVYLPDQTPTNLRTQGSANPNNAPMDILAEDGNFVPGPLPPPIPPEERDSDLFTAGSQPTATDSDTLTIKS